jgi:hypothetical protein
VHDHANLLIARPDQPETLRNHAKPAFVSAIGSVGSSSLAIAATSSSSIRGPQIVRIRDASK